MDEVDRERERGRQVKCPECGHTWKIPADEWPGACPECGFVYDEDDDGEGENQPCRRSNTRR